MKVIWASLELLRRALGGGEPCGAPAADDPDPLLVHASEVLERPACLAALLFVPSEDGRLLHGSGLVCPFLLGAEVRTGVRAALGDRGAASAPFAAPPPDFSAAGVFDWEMFFVRALGMRPAVSALRDPGIEGEARRVTQLLVCAEWWFGLAASTAQD